MITNSILTTIAWGAFVILLGLTLISESYRMFFWFGVGLILICLNIARHYSGTHISKFTFFIGIIALIGRGSGHHTQNLLSSESHILLWH